MVNKLALAVLVVALGVALYAACTPKAVGGGVYSPSWLTLTLFTSALSDYDHTVYPRQYAGTLKVLVVCTERANLSMANGNQFFTGNHPVEMLVPMLHMQAAGFGFDVATPSGRTVALEHWAMPQADSAVLGLHAALWPQLARPRSLADLDPASLDGYAAIFIPGGHGAMLDLPHSEPLGRILRAAHARALPTVTLCHGPGALLAAAVGSEDAAFAYDGYKLVVFPDFVDRVTPYLGYLPGPMPWFVAELLAAKRVRVVNTAVTGATHVDRELITGDSPQAANALGKLCAHALLDKYA